MLRFHLCQIWYNPAYFDSGFDLLEEPAVNPDINTSLTLGNLRSIESVHSLLIELRASYLKHITDKLCGIIHWSQEREANIIVFPEYSVPAESLSQIRDIATRSGTLVIAGTHRVRFTQTTKQIYSKLGLDTTLFPNGSAISPIFCPSGEILFSVKKAKSQWEPNLDVTSEASHLQRVDFKKNRLVLAISHV
jgi:hypothetical protein